MVNGVKNYHKANNKGIIHIHMSNISVKYRIQIQCPLLSFFSFFFFVQYIRQQKYVILNQTPVRISPSQFPKPKSPIGLLQIPFHDQEKSQYQLSLPVQLHLAACLIKCLFACSVWYTSISINQVIEFIPTNMESHLDLSCKKHIDNQRGLVRATVMKPL